MQRFHFNATGTSSANIFWKVIKLFWEAKRCSGVQISERKEPEHPSVEYWKKNNHNCSAVNALVEILNYRFYTIHKKQSPWSFPQINCSEKFHAWQSLILVRKFQIIVPQLTPSPVFSEWFCETFQNNCHWLHYFFHFCQKIVKWLTKQILDKKIRGVVINY